MQSYNELVVESSFLLPGIYRIQELGLGDRAANFQCLDSLLILVITGQKPAVLHVWNVLILVFFIHLSYIPFSSPSH